MVNRGNVLRSWLDAAGVWAFNPVVASSMLAPPTMAKDATTRRWYSKGAGRLVRALLGLPALAGSVWLFFRGGAASAIAGVALAILGLSLPLAAVFKEPD
jgi:hypothetical protein